MKLLYINPNSTVAMTDSIVEVARRANPGAEVLGWTNHDGPPAIEGPADGAAAVPGVLSLLPAAREEGVDAIVIACFDDTGLAEARAAAHCPVLGIGQSAYSTAGLLGHKFSVVTTLAVSVPVIEGNIRSLGADRSCASVRASGIPVLVVEEGNEETRAHIAQEVLAARDRDGATAAILGCAGMANLRDDLFSRTGLPLIDGVAASALLAETTAKLSALIA
ncbi:MAG: aspartate/glutamate racemase family protein [Pseudomonadota bacterium]|nr:aspartate/glutamate racemase family protein [Pseudomonadota bacterium]